MGRMHISRIYIDIHACFLMRSCTVFFFPPSSMLVGGKWWKAQEKRRQHSCFGHHMLYLHNVLRWDLNSIFGDFFLWRKSLPPPPRSACHDNIILQLLWTSPWALKRWEKLCGKNKRKDYLIHVNSSTMNTWVSRSWSLPRELPRSIAKSAIFLLFQHLLNVAGSNSCCQEFLHKWRLQLFAPGCFCWNFAQVPADGSVPWPPFVCIATTPDRQLFLHLLSPQVFADFTDKRAASFYVPIWITCMLAFFLPSFLHLYNIFF